jgi:oligopeptide/dipeptide ABC transporter ATP-binding protein
VSPLLEVSTLSVAYWIRGKLVPVVDDVSFTIRKGEVLAIVGESGCGKSQLALALAGLTPRQAQVTKETGQSGLSVAMIFQEPLSALNPLLTIGEQIREALNPHDEHSRKTGHGTRRQDQRAVVIDLLRQVGIPEPELRYRQYPHEFSGGMRQRVLIAMALARRPDLLIADEPTTALDVTVQAQILRLLQQINRDRGLSILFITHDLSLLPGFARWVMVMYAGKVVELAPVTELFRRPRHPYTRMLIRLARLIPEESGEFPSIPGAVPLPQEYPSGCRFHPRCPLAIDSCRIQPPEWREENGHGWACPVVEG